MSKRAIVIPDERIEVWDAESSFTQAGPRAGVPVPSQSGSMALGARGEQAAGTSYTVRTQRGGHPVRGGASYIYKETSSNDTNWRSWDPYTTVSGWEAASWTDGSGAPQWTRDPHAAGTENGSLLVVCRYRDSSATNEYGVRVYRRTVSSPTWTSVDVWGQSTAPTIPARSCLMALPNGRIHLYSIVVSVGSDASIAMWYSDDDGLSWNYGGEALNAPMEGVSVYRKIRAAYLRGQALLLVSCAMSAGVAERVYHYASDDMGTSFSLVEIVEGPSSYERRSADIAACDAGFVVAYVEDNSAGSDERIVVSVLGDAYALFSGIAGTDVSDITTATREAVVDGNAHLAAATTDDGSVLLYWIHGNAASPATVTGTWAVSWDGGTTWRTGLSTYRWWTPTDPSYPSLISATCHRGRVAIVGNWIAAVGNEDDSIGVWWLGGWTSVPQPPLYRAQDWRDRSVWSGDWVPIELPGDLGWTAGGGGTQSIGTPGILSLSCTSAQTRTYSVTPSAVNSTGIRVRCIVRPTAGGSTSTSRHAITVRVGDGSASYSVTLRLSTTQAQLYDDNAGANVGSAATVSGLSTSGGEFLIGLNASGVQVWYRTYSAADTDRLYTQLTSSSSLTDGGASTDLIQWGMLVTAGTTDTAEWIGVHYAAGDDAGAQYWPTMTFPVDSIGKDYGDGTYTDSSMSVIARDGPTWRGEEWVIAARYDYGMSRAVSVTSPRAGWRSTSTGDQTIAFRWDSLEEDTTESRYLAILLRKSTLTMLTVSLYDGSSWTSVAPAIKLGWDGLGYTRSGQVVVPSSGAGLWLDYGEARGASFALDTADARVVHSHREGMWATSGLRPALRLVDVESGDATSGTGTLTPETVCLLVRVDADTQGVKVLQVAPGASAPPPPASYWEVGSVVVGWVRVLDDPDWSQSEAMRANVEIDVARDATTRSRLAGPAQRVRSISWVDGAYDLTEHRWGAPSSTLDLGGYAIAAEFGAPLSLPAIVDRLGGGHVPFVYLSDVPDDPGALTVLKRREHILHGRVSSEITVSHVLGTEGEDELKRVGQMTITEEV